MDLSELDLPNVYWQTMNVYKNGDGVRYLWG